MPRSRATLPALAAIAALCMAPGGTAAPGPPATASPGVPGAQRDDPMAPVYVVSSRATWDTSLRGVARRPDARSDSLGRPVVVSRVRAHQLEDVARRVHERERRCGGYFAFPTRAAALAFLARDRTAAVARAQALPDYALDQQDQVARWLPQASEPAIRGTLLALSTDWTNRYFASQQGRASAEWIRDLWAELASDRGDATATLHHECWNCGQQPSVILTLRGTDLADEVVVLGGHLDSISSTGAFDAMVAPGADDNASGIAVLTEVIRIVLSDPTWRPRRTIKFMGYAAEEVGLRGSRAIAEAHAAAGERVVGVLQLDMTNYTDGTALDMRIISDYSNAPLQQFVRDLFDAYLAPAGHTRGASACGYACSDHASWTAVGYPAVFVAEPVLFPTRHTPSDKVPDIGTDASVSVPFAQLGLAFVAELAKAGPAQPTLPFCAPSGDPASGLFAGRDWQRAAPRTPVDREPLVGRPRAGR